MASRAAAGSVLKFASTSNVSYVRSLSFSEDGGDVDVTGLSSAAHEFAPGTPTIEMTAELTGAATGINVGDTGTMSITWNDGTSDTGGALAFICASREASGSVDGEIAMTLTFHPHNTAV